MKHNPLNLNKIYYHRYYANGEIKPFFRGVFHLISLLFAPFTIIPLILYCNSLKEIIGVIIYKFIMILCLFVSSIFHIGNWNKITEKRIQMLDHACILLVVTFSWTLVGILYMMDSTFIYVAPGVTLIMFSINAFINSSYKVHTYFIASIIILSYSYEFVPLLTNLEITLIVLTYIQYLSGLYIYSTQKLDLYPSVFGYHEIFHLLTVGAFITTYIVNLSLVIRN